MNRRELICGGISTSISGGLGVGFVSGSDLNRRSQVMWRRTGHHLSFEQATLTIGPETIDISGVVIAELDHLPVQVNYQITCDAAWRTRAITVKQSWKGSSSQLQLDHDGKGHWQRDQKDAEELDGCTDVDLSISPATNALPINRLKLRPDVCAEITVVWIGFPEFNVEAMRQSYRRLEERRYQYRNLATGFTASIDVDEDGLPIGYGSIWRRLVDRHAEPAIPCSGLSPVLIRDGAHEDNKELQDAFGWLVGGWTLKVRDFDPDGKDRLGEGEWWFSWVLEGRAIQDVLIIPLRRGSLPTSSLGPSSASNRYGTTVRWFDQQAKVLRIVWINPVSGITNTLVGHREGGRIYLLGLYNGEEIRWSFINIEINSFLWRGEQKTSGKWILVTEFDVRRIMCP